MNEKCIERWGTALKDLSGKCVSVPSAGLQTDVTVTQNVCVSFIISLLYASTCFEHCCAHHQEVKIVLYSIWYRHTETSEWSKITKIQFYKYEHIVKFMYEFFGFDYCILLAIIVLCRVEVTFIQLLNWLKRYYVLMMSTIVLETCRDI